MRRILTIIVVTLLIFTACSSQQGAAKAMQELKESYETASYDYSYNEEDYDVKITHDGENKAFTYSQVSSYIDDIELKYTIDSENNVSDYYYNVDGTDYTNDVDFDTLLSEGGAYDYAGMKEFFIDDAFEYMGDIVEGNYEKEVSDDEENFYVDIEATNGDTCNLTLKKDKTKLKNECVDSTGTESVEEFTFK